MGRGDAEPALREDIGSILDLEQLQRMQPSREARLEFIRERHQLPFFKTDDAFVLPVVRFWNEQGVDCFASVEPMLTKILRDCVHSPNALSTTMADSAYDLEAATWPGYVALQVEVIPEKLPQTLRAKSAKYRREAASAVVRTYHPEKGARRRKEWLSKSLAATDFSRFLILKEEPGGGHSLDTNVRWVSWSEDHQVAQDEIEQALLTPKRCFYGMYDLDSGGKRIYLRVLLHATWSNGSTTVEDSF